jgi:hypothetical protein
MRTSCMASASNLPRSTEIVSEFALRPFSDYRTSLLRIAAAPGLAGVLGINHYCVNGHMHALNVRKGIQAYRNL